MKEFEEMIEESSLLRALADKIKKDTQISEEEINEYLSEEEEEIER